MPATMIHPRGHYLAINAVLGMLLSSSPGESLFSFACRLLHDFHESSPDDWRVYVDLGEHLKEGLDNVEDTQTDDSHSRRASGA